MAFIGGLSLYTSLADEAKGLTGSGDVLTGLGSIGVAFLLIGYTLEPLGAIAQVPGWVDAFGVGIPLGQIGLLLFGIAALRSQAYSKAVALALVGPLFAFVIFFIGAGIVGTANAPYWAPFATVSLQTIAHLLLAAVMPSAVPQVAEESAHQPSAA